MSFATLRSEKISRRPINRCTPIGLLLLPLLVATVSAQDSDPRKTWTYKTVAGIRKIVEQEDDKWILHFPNGTSTELVELKRTDEFIELRNPKNGFVQRLYADRGLVQKAKDGPFRKFTDGQWTKGETPPAAKPQESDYRVRVVYFLPSDRTATADYEKKIRVVVSIISEVFDHELRSKGHRAGGPKFEEKDGQVVVHLYKAEKTAREYSDVPTWNSGKHFSAIKDEIDRQLFSTRENIVMVFAETHEQGPAQRVWPGHIAKAVALPPRGGIAVFSAWMLQDEFCATDVTIQKRLFFDETPIRNRKAIGGTKTPSARADFIEDSIGGMLHELAHTFGLPHDARDARVNIMGQGFRSLRWNMTTSSSTRATFSKENTWLLTSSRYINPEVDRSDASAPKMQLEFSGTRQAPVVIVKAVDDKGLRTIVFLDESGSGEAGGKGRQLIAGQMLSGKSRTIRQKLPASILSTSNPVLQVILVDQGGNHTKVSRNLGASR